MNKWKLYKNAIKSELSKNKIVSVYELNYSHVLFKVNDCIVYDVDDKCFYSPQTGNI